VVRDLPVFGYVDRLGHGEIVFVNVRVPVANMLGGEGQGSPSPSSGSAWPHALRHAAVGFAERGLELMVRR